MTEKQLLKPHQLSDFPVTDLTSDSSEIVCYRCNSTKYIKGGFKAGKQRYICKDCKHSFTINPKFKPLYCPDEFQFDWDVWSDKQLGLQSPLHRNDKKINFAHIQQHWFKVIVKKFIYYCSTNRGMTTLISYVHDLRAFSDFLLENPQLKSMEIIERSTIIDYLAYLQKRFGVIKTRKHRINTLKLLLEAGSINNWFHAKPYLIRQEDIPKLPEPLPRYIPEKIMQQLNQHLDALPEAVMRMTLVIQECGFRISELCTLRLDCLKQDSKGAWYVQYMRGKIKKEHTKPVSKELAEVILEQKKYIQENLGNNFDYLFCGRKPGKRFIPRNTFMSDESFVNHLKRLAKTYKIKDSSTGEIWNFETHQFRHTVGTRMINLGVPQHIVQRYLGHQSPSMTMVYAHIHDETLRREIDKYHDSRVVNFQGETVELEKTVLSSDEDLEWFKKKVSTTTELNVRPSMRETLCITGIVVSNGLTFNYVTLLTS